MMMETKNRVMGIQGKGCKGLLAAIRNEERSRTQINSVIPSHPVCRSFQWQSQENNATILKEYIGWLVLI
jgi:hypothetical protein